MICNLGDPMSLRHPVYDVCNSEVFVFVDMCMHSIMYMRINMEKLYAYLHAIMYMRINMEVFVFVDMCMHSIFIRIYIMECKYSIFKHSIFIRMYIPHLYTYVYTFYICTRMCIHSIFIHIWYTHICILICVFIHIYVYIPYLYTYMEYLYTYTFHIYTHTYIYIHHAPQSSLHTDSHEYMLPYNYTSASEYLYTYTLHTPQNSICIWICIHLHIAYASEFYLHLNIYTPTHCIHLRIPYILMHIHITL